MWRPDWLTFARSPHYILRLGQAQFQLWRGAGQRLEQIATRSSQHIGHSQYQAVTDELIELSKALPTRAAVQVLIDSKWMPLSLLATGRAPLSGAQVHALARHRFTDVFGEQAQSWRVQTNHVSGDAQALAFACNELLLDSVRQGLGLDTPGGQGQIRLQGMQPTFAWVCNQVWRRQASKTDDWLVFAEHDRSVIARIAHGRIQALQAAGPLFTSPAQLAAVLPAEALRCGIVEASHSALGISMEARADMVREPSTAGVRWFAMARAEATT